MNARLVRPWGVWLLCLGLVGPGVGRAAQVAPTVSPPAVEEPAAPEPQAPSEVQQVPDTSEEGPYRPLLTEQERRRERQRELEQEEWEEWEMRTQASRGPRILGEVGGGVLGAAALGAGGGLTGYLLCELVTGGKGFDLFNCLLPAYLGAIAGVLGGAPLGVWGAGELLGGSGSVALTAGGGALGLIGGFVLLVVVGSVASPYGTASALLFASVPVLGMAGCVIGYEVFQKMPRPRRWAAREGLQPMLAFTAGSAVVGLSGHF